MQVHTSHAAVPGVPPGMSAGVTRVTDSAGRPPHNENMKTWSTEQTVGALAAGIPAAVSVFERHHIDFCCGGGIALHDACRARGLDPEEVLEEVRQAGRTESDASVDWETAPLGDLVDHIVGRHHEYLKAQLPRLRNMLDKVLKVHGERHGEVLGPLAACFRRLQEDLEDHLRKEETIVFPALRRLDSPASHPQFDRAATRVPIEVLIGEHDSAGEVLSEMRRLTGGYQPPKDACNTFRTLYIELEDLDKDLRVHVHLENNILFPRALGRHRMFQ